MLFITSSIVEIVLFMITIKAKALFTRYVKVKMEKSNFKRFCLLWYQAETFKLFPKFFSIWAYIKLSLFIVILSNFQITIIYREIVYTSVTIVKTFLKNVLLKQEY